VIYSDQGDLRGLVGPGGLGYHPGSVPQLADRMTRLLEDPALRHGVASAAAIRGARLDWTVIAERVVRFATGAPHAAVADPLETLTPIAAEERDLAAGAL
jgi:glycosyltransferase involved in cell wall biosynthesis